MGQEVDVRVVGVDRENKKIALSLKQVEENPWTRIEQKYHVGDTVPAKITKLAQFGAFAELEPGVEGLVHISELSDERITHPKQVVREGEDVQLRIIKIDPQRHRLGLSLRQAEDTGEYRLRRRLRGLDAAARHTACRRRRRRLARRATPSELDEPTPRAAEPVHDERDRRPNQPKRPASRGAAATAPRACQPIHGTARAASSARAAYPFDGVHIGLKATRGCERYTRNRSAVGRARCCRRLAPRVAGSVAETE